MESIVICNNCQHSFLPKDSTPLFPIIDNLKDLLRSNQLPSCMDTQQASSYIEAEGRELEKFEKEITRLHNILEKLEAHREAMLKRMEHCRSWVSPIRRLPVEILENIFAFVCTPESGSYALDVDFTTNKSISAPILTLTHVSCRWRAVANASPSLWSSIRIDLSCHHLTGDKMKRFESSLIHYLTRSREHPLHLIGLHYHSFHQISVQTLLAPHIPRIASLDFVRQKIPDHDILGRLPSLLQNASKLSDVAIYCNYPGQLDPNKLPWHQLRVLEIVHIIDTRPLGPVLQLCTNLCSLTLHLVFHAGSSVQMLNANALIQIRSLRRLALNCHPAGLALLPHLVLPSLSSFTISSTFDTPTFAPVIDLIRRSGCHLNQFTMKIHHGSVNIPDAELYEFLTLCPELSQLECDVLNPRRKDMVPGMFVCQLLDVLCPANSHQLPIPFTPAPNSKLAHVVISERWFLLDPGAVDRLLGRLEAKVGDLKDYRARVPVPRWKWDLWFGAPPECAPEVFQRFKSRIDKLAKSGLKWTVVEPIADGPSKDSSCVRYDSVFEFAHRPSQGLSSLLAYLGM